MPQRVRRTDTECIAFGKALRRLRGEIGLKQNKVAAKAHITKAMVSSYETGKMYPTLPTLLAYLRAVGADFSDLQRSIESESEDFHLRFKELAAFETTAELSDGKPSADGANGSVEPELAAELKDDPENVEREVGRRVLALMRRLRQGERTQAPEDAEDDHGSNGSANTEG